MFTCIRKACSTTLVASSLLFSAAGIANAQSPLHPVPDGGIVQVKSAYSVPETVTRIKADVASKGIRFFEEIDQAKLASAADENGQVWAAYTDFSYIARRHAVSGADAEAFGKASGVIASITSSVTTR